MDIQRIIELDQWLLTFLNGSDNLFLDGVVTTLTSGWSWMPLYLALLYVVIKNNDTMGQILLTVGCALLCVIVADGVVDGIVKPWVARPRPLNDPIFRYAVDTVYGIGDKHYSFFSGHASNTFSLAVFFSLLIRDRAATTLFVLWSLLNCWTRLYLGMHYPSDILVGLLWGGLVGSGVYALYRYAYFRVSPRISYVSSQYTSTGYDRNDVDVPICMVTLTLLYAVVKALLQIF